MRRPHAVLEAESRLKKAQKISVLLSQHTDLENLKVLDIGSGAGFISSALARAVGPGGEVWAVDTTDQRQVFEGFSFVPVEGTTLPFEDESFDVVVSNHVIEHVGTRADQLHHLREVRRVLRSDGLTYVSSPNRWTLVEPHFHLPFLSWLPERFRSPYVRALKKGEAYDCDLFTYGELTETLERAGFSYVDKTIEAMRVMAQVEAPPAPVRMILEMPAGIARALRTFIPTFIFVARKSESPG